jgi:hypothetical protein
VERQRNTEVAAFASLDPHAPCRQRRRPLRLRDDGARNTVAARPEICEQSDGRDEPREERQLDGDAPPQTVE